MADKAISELIEATTVTQADLFVLEQSGSAKKLTGQTLINDLTKALDGHGGIQSIGKVSTDVLADTYRLTFADASTYDIIVTNGKGISSITKTSTNDLVDTYTILYNDGAKTTFTVTNGAKGDTGAAAYVWIKWASQEPTEDSHSFGDIPDAWLGIYAGTSATAPTDWTQYQWFEIKGEQGDPGVAASLVSSAVEYMVSTSGTVIPSGSWTTAIPTVAQGKYLWTRTTQTYNTGDPIVSYSVSRMGIDGAGSVVTVNLVSPDADGNVALKAADIGAVATDGSSTMAGALNMGGNKITRLGTPTDDADAVTVAYLAGLLQGYAKASHVEDTDNPHSVTAAQVGAAPAAENTTYSGCYYRNVNGNTEWINPPMVAGKEYRTTERFNEKPVYAKMVNFGELPNSTYKQVGVSTNIDAIVRMDGYAYWTDGTYSSRIPLTSVDVTVELYSYANLRLTASSDLSGWSAYVALYYTKSTD